jgi:uncharacterized protein (TIGR02996 family)
MDQLAALRAAVYAAPADDATRLVLGDYLLDRGDPRGELVHVQTKLARSASSALYDRQHELIAKLGRPPNGVTVTYERGFTQATVEAWHANEDVLGYLADEPLLESLTITRCTESGGGGWWAIGQMIDGVLDRLRVLRLEDLVDVSEEVRWDEARQLPDFGAVTDHRPECAAMFAKLRPRPATLALVELPAGVELPASWRR